MKRRDILKYTAYATGAAVCSPLLGTILAGCSIDSNNFPDDFTPQFFNEDEFRVINSMVDTILPKTSSPAASEVGVDKMIDTIVGTMYKKADKEDYRKRFAELNIFLQEQAGGTAFNKLSEKRKLTILQQLESQDISSVAVKTAYLALKQQTIAFYLTTEEVAKNFLNYLPVPGEYEACIPLADVGGKAWAL